MNVVKDLRTLRGMRDQGLVEFCRHTGKKISGLYSNELFTCYYVYEAKSNFMYKGKKYTEKYFDGCFYPYVVEVTEQSFYEKH